MANWDKPTEDPMEVHINKIIALQNEDRHLLAIKRFLNKDDNTNQFLNLPHNMKHDLLRGKYSVSRDLLLFENADKYKHIVLPKNKNNDIIIQTANNNNNDINDNNKHNINNINNINNNNHKNTDNIDINYNIDNNKNNNNDINNNMNNTMNMNNNNNNMDNTRLNDDKLILIQNNDIYLLIIKQYIKNEDFLCLHTLLPSKMKNDLFSQKYHICDNLLYYKKDGISLIVLPPTNEFYHRHPLIINPFLFNTHLINTQYKQPIDEKLQYIDHNALKYNNQCYSQQSPLSFAAEYDHGINEYESESHHSYYSNHSNPSNHSNNSYESHQSFYTQNSHNTYGAHNHYMMHCNDNRCKNINGTMFYAQFGDKLEDWMTLKVVPSNFVYHRDEYTLICGECDFSFTASLIKKRGGSGINICCTSWYYYRCQWFQGIPKQIGEEEFSLFLKNLKFCKKNAAKMTFGIDAKLLNESAKQWNKINIDRFDRIIFTFPRIFNQKKQHKWNKIEYNKENEILLTGILKAAKNYLNKKNGEIHIMLLKGQFCNWRIQKILKLLNLELAYWSQLDQDSLNIYFNAYIPRDGYGNAMKIGDSKIHFCSFKNIN